MPETHAVPVEDGETVVAVHHECETRPEGASRDCERRPEGSREPERASPPSADWIVFCHGFLSDKSGSYERRCERVAGAGYDAVRFDFRGSGESDRAFVDATLSTRIADLRAVLEYFDPGSVALFGSSFGAKVALHAACEGRSGASPSEREGRSECETRPEGASRDCERPPEGSREPERASPSTDDRVAAVVGRAPVTYNRAFEEYRDPVDEAGTLRIDDDHAIDGRFFEDFDGYDFDDVAAGLDVPVALFHGTDDGSVPLADSLDAVAALETDVLLQTYRGEGHRFSAREGRSEASPSAAAEERLLRQTLDWLATV